MAKQNKPAIRFKGFTDAWEQRKLGEIATEKLSNGVMNNASNEDTGVRHINVVNMYTLDKIHIEDLTFSSYGENILKKCNIEIGDIFLTRSSLKPEGIAEANVLLDSGRFVYDDHLIRLKVKENLYDPLFVKINLGTAFIKHQFIEKSKTTAFTTIGQDDIAECVGNFPLLREQQQIAAFFRHLDNLITLHQRKYDKLQVLKKAMLEKMFPKNGSSVPEIRFKGFTDAWEQRKVGELIEDYIEKTTVQNQYPVLTSSQQQGVVFQEDYFADRQVTTNDNIGYYVLPYGYFTYRSRSDTDVFVFNRNNIIDKGIISYYYPVFLPKDCDSNFLLRRLNHGIKKQLSMAAEGTGQKVLAHNKFKNMIVDVPEIEEQQKIGLYFESLDHLITLHQRELEKLQNIKKSMLEKMFV